MVFNCLYDITFFILTFFSNSVLELILGFGYSVLSEERKEISSVSEREEWETKLYDTKSLLPWKMGWLEISKISASFLERLL